jgi:hypothetical protein
VFGRRTSAIRYSSYPSGVVPVLCIGEEDIVRNLRKEADQRVVDVPYRVPYLLRQCKIELFHES